MNSNENQPTNLADAVNPDPLYAGAFNFVDSISSGIEYKYDANGNLTEDLNKKIARIQYNSLNLPSRLQFTQGYTTVYLYDADGVKRNVKQVTTTQDLMVPMGSTLSVPTDKIAVKPQTYYYDHQGNNRVIFNQTGTIEQTNHFYSYEIEYKLNEL